MGNGLIKTIVKIEVSVYSENIATTHYIRWPPVGQGASRQHAGILNKLIPFFKIGSFDFR